MSTDFLLDELGRLNLALSDAAASQWSARSVNVQGLCALVERLSEGVTTQTPGRHLDLLAVYIEVQAMVEDWEAWGCYEQLPRGAREFVLGWRALARAAADSSAEENPGVVVEPDPLRALLRYRDRWVFFEVSFVLASLPQSKHQCRS